MSAKTGLPLIHLDLHFWKPGWTEPSEDEWRNTQRALLASDQWIADGNYNATLDLRLERADTVVVLDTPWWLCASRAFVRGIRRPAGTQMPDPGRQDWPVDANRAAETLVAQVRSRPWGIAVAAVGNGDVQLQIDEGADRLGERTPFQIGSITKTMTGVLLADAVLRGETTLDAPLRDVLEADAGRCADITLRDLATQRSGLPRLPPNLDLASIDQTDPYAE